MPTILQRPRPLPLAPAGDALLDHLIGVAEAARDGRATPDGAHLVVHALPSLLRELQAHRRYQNAIRQEVAAICGRAANLPAPPPEAA